MKKIWSIVLCAAMLLALTVCVAGCPLKPPEEEQPAIIGSWTATKLKEIASGTVYPIGEVIEGTFSAKFTDDGLCEYTIGSKHFKEVKWEETGNRIKILDQAGSFYVTVNEDSTLSVNYSEGGADYELIHEKDGK